MTGYHLVCPVCKKAFEDTYSLSCPDGCTGLIRAEYDAHQLTIRDAPGVFRYGDWLPVSGTLPTRAAPVAYTSSRLGERLGLDNLWICFSGYWPERDAYVVSGSFKEFEALPTIVRLRERTKGVILVASAGNTGRAFAQVSAETGQPVIVVVPESSRERIRTTVPGKDLFLITIDGDYTDAINLGKELCTIPGIFPEGGAANVARRDGMGTVMLAGVVAMGGLPDWYVQAVGSGTGGIAAYEAAERLIRDGRFGRGMPRLCLFQSEPFTPMVRAWQAGRREIRDEDMPNAKEAISQVYSDVLTNRAPPYSIPGGLYDALIATRGVMSAVSTEEALAAGKLFTECEGIDLDPAAAVCVAGLVKTVKEGLIQPEERVLLNITGGGYERVRKDLPLFTREPDCSLPAGGEAGAIREKVSAWVKQYV